MLLRQKFKKLFLFPVFKSGLAKKIGENNNEFSNPLWKPEKCEFSRLRYALSYKSAQCPSQQKVIIFLNSLFPCCRDKNLDFYI